MTQKITPFLWIENDALGAGKYYKSVFGESNVTTYNEEKLENTPSGSVHVITLKIFDINFRIMAAGKHDPFNDSISFEVTCKDQSEIDTYWNAIVKEGGEQQCGWCMDKYGVRWQIVPENMPQLISTKEGMEKMLKMKKIVIADF